MSSFKLTMALTATQYPFHKYLRMAREKSLIYSDYTKVKVTQKLFYNTFSLAESTGDRETSINAIFQSPQEARDGIFEDMNEYREGEEKEAFEYPNEGDTIYLTTSVWHEGRFYVLEYLTHKPLRL